MDKIILFRQLKSFLNKISKHNVDKLVLVGGCFDILHLGHARFLKEAKKYGAVVVALESDHSLKKFKGVNRPIHKQTERAEVLSHLESVNFILLLPYFNSHQQYYDLVEKIQPDFIVVTEGDKLLDKKQEQAKLVSAKLIIIPKINTPSTTQLAKLLQLE